jgi:hypothetical protein
MTVMVLSNAHLTFVRESDDGKHYIVWAYLKDHDRWVRYDSDDDPVVAQQKATKANRRLTQCSQRDKK